MYYTQKVSDEEMRLREDMRLAWEQHVYWTRMLIISIAERLPDEKDVAARLLQNPYDIAEIFARYYPRAVAKTIAELLREHLEIGTKLVRALRDNRSAEADRLNREWYINADKIAETFSGINPYYSRGDVREMFYNHLQLTTEEAAKRLARRYPEDIIAFDNIEREALVMADYFSEGIIHQFSQKFS